MSVDIYSDDGGWTNFSNRGWHLMSLFAESQGWRPANPDAEEFTAAEMASFADALDGGLDRLTLAEIGAILTDLLVTPPAPGSTSFRSDPIEINAKAVAAWREFAAFARGGAARVEY